MHCGAPVRVFGSTVGLRIGQSNMCFSRNGPTRGVLCKGYFSCYYIMIDRSVIKGDIDKKLNCEIFFLLFKK